MPTWFGGGWWNNQGGPAPNAPTLAIRDNQDGASALGSVSGSSAGSSNVIWTMPVIAGGMLTDQGSRLGDGNLTLSLTPGYYLGFCLSYLGTAASLSNLVLFSTSNTLSGGIGCQSESRIDPYLLGDRWRIHPCADLEPVTLYPRLAGSYGAPISVGQAWRDPATQKSAARASS